MVTHGGYTVVAWWLHGGCMVVSHGGFTVVARWFHGDYTVVATRWYKVVATWWLRGGFTVVAAHRARTRQVYHPRVWLGIRQR